MSGYLHALQSLRREFSSPCRLYRVRSLPRPPWHTPHPAIWHVRPNPPSTLQPCALIAPAIGAANTTQQTEGLRLRRGAKPQAVQEYDKAKQRRIKGGVRFYVLRQAVFGSNCSGLNTAFPRQTAKATRSSLRPRITIDSVVEKPFARICAYSGFNALLWLAANAARYICLRSKAGPRLLKRRLPRFVPESLARGSSPL